MKRRLTLARALINDPDLIFMDEPTTGLDPQARHLIWERLKQLLAQGKTIVLTTHFMEEAERLCARLAIMDHGRFITEGSPRDLIARHIEPHVVEVHGDGVAEWAEREAGPLASRVEKSGDTVFCYATDPAPLLASLARREALPARRVPGHGVIDEKVREVEQPGEPGHDEDDMKRLDPEHRYCSRRRRKSTVAA